MNRINVFWWRWLVTVAVGVIVFGITLVAAPDLTRSAFSLLVFSSPNTIGVFSEPAFSYVGLAHAVVGALMFGWGIMILFILLGPFRRGSREAWLTIVIPLTAWFVPDTAFSLLSGFWQNAVLNTVFGGLFAVPLVATYGTFFERHS